MSLEEAIDSDYDIFDDSFELEDSPAPVKPSLAKKRAPQHPPSTEKQRAKGPEKNYESENEDSTTDEEDFDAEEEEVQEIDLGSKEFKKFIRGLKKSLVELRDKLCSVKEKVGSQEINCLIGDWTVEQKKVEDVSQLSASLLKEY